MIEWNYHRCKLCQLRFYLSRVLIIFCCKSEKMEINFKVVPPGIAWRLGISIAGQLIESVSPRFLFIMVVILIYLFVLDDSVTEIHHEDQTTN